jgi:hypothetical protein
MGSTGLDSGLIARRYGRRPVQPGHQHRRRRDSSQAGGRFRGMRCEGYE